ncbi:VOC family protein [Aquipuribacter hungaricus]|uniref:VOC family protein n=1 Tax=Aquipuribacter hungaricus TaxID=545624 RepID=A0ABV7WH01_9MICO
MKLAFLFLPVSDLAAAEELYRGRLGLDEAWREGDSTVALASPGGDVQLMLSTDPYPAGPMFEVADAAAWEAAHDDIPVAVPRYAIPGGEVVGFSDPGGNVFYVFDQA